MDHKDEQSSLMTFLERLDHKVERLDRRLDSVDKTLVKQEANLDKHILRTDLAEENLKLLRTDLRGVETEIKPLKKHVAQVEIALKIAGILASIALACVGAVSSILKILSLLNH